MNILSNLHHAGKSLFLSISLVTSGIAVAMADGPAAASASPQKWDLPPIVGDQNGWGSVDNNWTTDRGNPCQDNGASWTVAMQSSAEPDLTGEFKPMSDGLLYNFVHGWVDGSNVFDPPQFYVKRTLTTMSSGADTGVFPENSRSSAIIFKPPTAGTYHLEMAGTVGVQMKSAGYASVCIYTLKTNRSASTLIDRQLLGDVGGYQNYPNKLAFDRDIDIAADEELVVRLQTISPGQAPAGHSSINFDKFTVSAKTAGAPSTSTSGNSNSSAGAGAPSAPGVK